VKQFWDSKLDAISVVLPGPTGVVQLLLLLVALAAQAQPSSPPTISFIADQGVFPNSTSRPVAFVIGDGQTSANLLNLSAVSANQTLVTNSAIVFGGSGSNRTATITPSLNQTGATTITITVADSGGGAASNSFILDVAYFTPVTSALPALGEGTVVWGDYDNDGRLDVLTTGSGANGGEAYIFRNAGSGIFTNINAGLTNFWRGTASWVDYNRDGRLDVLLTGGYPQNPPQLYRNDGGGIFTPVNSGLPFIHDGGSFGAVAWGDFNNDGAFDIALSGQSTNLTPSTFVYRNNSDGTFANAPANLPGTSGGSLDWGDFDNDGDLDLAVSGRGISSTQFVKVFRNDGGVFTEAATNFPGVWLSTTLWGDYDNDGDLDLLLTGSIGDYNPQSRIYRNDGGAFTDIGAGLTGVWFSQAGWADFDNDGYLDVILGGRDSVGATVTRLYRNNRNQTFSQINAGLVNIQSGSYAWGDYDSDGDLDLLAMGYNCDFGCTMVQLYRNNGPTNLPPVAPTGLNVTLQPGNDVTLRWTAATDSQTPGNGLGYNLRVGTNSGGIQVSPPQSDLATGFRRVPQSGPAHTNRWRLVDLAKGTYYWAVQAVDATYAGSLFSTQAVFTITNSRPAISTISNLVTFPNVAVSNISFTVGDAETAATALVVTRSSGNTNLLPDASVLLGGSGSNRTVTLIPVNNRSGEVVVTLTVTDPGGLTRSASFTLRIEAFTQMPFIGPAARPNTVGATYVSWVDYDLDGDLDVLFSREGFDPGLYREVLMLRNEGGGVFLPVDAGFGDFFISSAAWGDVNGDGYPDLFATGEVAGDWPYAARLYLNNGNGTFTQSAMQFPPVRFGSVAVADINGDGGQDLFITGPTNNSGPADLSKIYANNGSGGFSEWANDLPGFGIYSATSQWGDVDNDGDLDLLVSNGRLFRNDGDGHFSDISNRIPPPPWGYIAGNWADFDNDGDLDILVTGTTNVICRNNGDGTFTHAASGITNIYYSTTTVLADYDNDGAMDVVLSVDGGLLFHNNGNGTFALAQTNFPPGVWGDYDNDGNQDLLVNGVIYRNRSGVTNTPPSAPLALAAAQQPGASVLFNWSRPADAQNTNAAGLHYNLRVGTSPTTSGVVSPIANMASGYRRIVQRGNAGCTNRWVLRNLPRGTYYWNVQAMDAALAGSPFSTNGSFVVTRPDISPIADQFVAPGFQPAPIPFTIYDGETAANNLVLSASSSNTNLVAVPNIVFSGLGTNRSVTLTPTPGVIGTNIITVTVTDGDGFTDSSTFTFIVTPFLPAGNLSVGASSRVYPADYNNDSLMDVLVIGSTVQLWRNLGGGNFTNDATGLPASITGRGAWGDYDNDGYLDLAFGDSTNVYHNDITNHFTAVPSGMNRFDYTMSAVAWADYDGDGRLDLMRVNWRYVQLFRNLGGGIFTNSGFTPQWGEIGSLGWADLNNDGKLDFVVSGDFGGGSFSTYIYRGNVGTNLTPAVNAIIGVFWSSVAFRDFDADGDLDMLLAGHRSPDGNATCRVYRNDGDFTFTNYVELATNTVRNAAWGDYNNDGRPDVLAYGGQATMVFANNGNGTFTNTQVNLPGVDNNGAAWADFDKDGDLDIVADKLFANLRPLTNQPPLVPSALSANFVSNAVLLSWNAPADDTTSSGALTYALRLDTNSGGSQILTADADPVSGSRRAVPEVNTWPSPWRLVKNLHEGNYFWSVQAIDSGFAGSPFAQEASFSYFHPTISGPTNVVTYAASPSALVSLVVGDADSAASTLALSVYFSNTNLLNATNFVFGGSGSNRTVTITLPPGAVGTSVVSTVVTDITGLTGTNTFVFESSYFSDVTPVFTGGNYYNAHWADFDNDNDLDVFYGGLIYRNDGNDAFVQVAAPGSANRNGLAWGDYDRDGDADFAISDGSTLRIFANQGGGVFAYTGQSFILGGTAALAWGDFDNDGDLDLAVTQPGTSRIYRNDSGTFTLFSATLPPSSDGAVTWGDFDNDGDLDLLIAGLGSGPLEWRAEIYRNDGGAVFTAINAGLFGTDHSSVAWGDYDNDGLLDALVTGFNFGSYVLKVYHNNGNGTFADLNLPLQGVAYSDAGFGDFDNDGWTDIHLNGCIVNYCDASIMAIYRNNHEGTFSDLNAGMPPTTAAQVGVGDYDNDGDLDLLANRLYRNDAPVPNQPPSTPSAAVAQLLPDNNVLLTWQASSDPETANAGLSYDVRVGTTPGGVQHVSPSADTVSGYRRVPQRGAANTNFYLLRDVPKGIFFWSVQAIDPVFAGSAFSGEGTFTISNARPIISAISNQITPPGRATLPIGFTVSDLETAATNLVLGKTSSNTALVPAANVVFGGAGSNRTVTITPAGNLTGTATIVVSVMDAEGLAAISRFDVSVQLFQEVSVGLPTGNNLSSAWGDYDNDGDLDIAVAGGSFTTVYRNTNGLFTNQNFTLNSATASDLAWLDADNDGDLDLMESGWLSAGYSPATLRFRNNFPTNTFTSLGSGLSGVGTTNIADGAMAWGDYDNDGDLDVVLSGDTNTYHTPDAFTALYRNDRGTFTNSGVVLPALVHGAAVWGDYDDDGDLDLLIAGQTGGIATNSVTKLFRNEGNGAFVEVATPFPSLTDCALAFGDMDNDGDLDIAMAGLGTDGVPLARIYRNTGSGFTNLNANLLGATFASVAWGDYDSDGFIDLVVSGSTNSSPYNLVAATTRVYRNYGGSGFTNTGGTLPGVMLQNTSWGDADNDGDLDLLVGTRLVRNHWNVTNAPPSVPTNLSVAFLANGDLRLDWSRATDAQTTNASGLRYNLRLGTNSGGGEIVSPHASNANGYRRVPDFGNAGPTNSWRIANLTNATYYWSVQAIDGGLVGSAFAVEQTFTLSRPVFSVITNRSAPPNTVVGPINFTVSDGETAASNLVVTASSSDTNLLPNAGLVLSGTSTNRTLTLTPVTNRSGSVTITLTAVDESGQVGGRSFLLTIERFADISAGLTPVVGQVVWGDYDNDGDLDLVRGSTIYRNDGGAGFANIAAGLPASGVMTAAWGDSDNDGDLDLIIAGSGIRGLYRNDGNDVFSSVVPNAGGNPNTSVAWGDYDNDGDLDFLFAYSNYTYPYRNDGSNGFTQITAGLPIVNVGSVAWGDYDKDGDLDILMAGNGLTRIYRNNGNGTFTDTAMGLPVSYLSSVAWGDFDNDGWLDFALAGSTNNNVIGVVTRIYRNVTLPASGNRAFTNYVSALAPNPQGVWKGTVAWGDYDNDGDLDLLVSGETMAGNAVPLTKIYRNDDGSFFDSGLSLPALRNAFVAWGDYDGDGALDIALSGNDAVNASISRIYRNFSNGVTNALPGAPSALTNLVVGKSVRLSWNAAADPNQNAGVSYNLRVGTYPGAANIVSPMANASGTRTIPALGNANERLTWTITNLTGGTFYWSVQAVDHSFAGSAFATERSFVVSNQVPNAVTQSTTTTEDVSKAIVLTGSDADADPLTFNIAAPPLFGQLTGTPPNVTYRPNTNYFGFDQFTFYANDRTTNSLPAAVFVTVTPVEDVGASSLSIAPGTGGQPQIGLMGEPWRSYRIEASEDLIHWLPLTNVLATNLLMLLVDADAPNFPHRFYRAAQFDAVPTIGGAQLNGGSQFQFVLNGEAGRNYQLQASSNLVAWTTLTNVIMTNASVPFRDGEAPKFPQRFYRLVAP